MKASEVVLCDKKNVGGQNSAKVLIQLRDMYTSGFSLHSPTRPLLNGHFFLSFSVIVSDWVYLYFLLRGYIATFPLRTWIALVFVKFASMNYCMLKVLCIENAFAHPNEVTEFSAGCAVINESFTQWLQAFNNFRISFLFMVFRDIPITVLNFFYISPCRCAGPQVIK
uniref:Innexin n=1 Tax=Syphacia muris TaxID=451379 RepID=A0A0N5AL55_9BILA